MRLDLEAIQSVPKKWKPVFDPKNKPTSFQQIWVLLPRLPLELWNSKKLEGVENAIGHFISLEENFSFKYTRVIKMLAETDLREALPTDIEIALGKWIFN